MAQTAPDTGKRDIVDGVSVSDLRMERHGGYLAVEMVLDLDGLKVDGNRAVLLTPRLVNGADSTDLPSVGVYGRRRYYHYVRDGKSMLSGKDETSYMASRKPGRMEYSRLLPYAGWMDGAVLSLHRSDYGCCNTLLAERAGTLDRLTGSAEFFPELVYVRPRAETDKSRSREGSAFIDFPVDRTEIYPDYRGNAAELGRIQSTIDSVRDDGDITITQVWLKGFASPEGTYAHNRDLAMGRTAALKEHIQRLYRFGDGIIVTDHEPEDWAGLRRYVERSNIGNRDAILALIDSDREPDSKEAAIRRGYPEEYRFMLRNWYPALRHTDYRIAYNIRVYDDVEEIRKVFATRPQNLSLNEFYLMAQECEPGSDEFTEVFDLAVRMFPADSTANLNAANAAIRRDDFTAAERYLAKAGDSAEADYARGALAIRKGDTLTARTWLEAARDKGLPQAGVTLEELEKTDPMK